MRAGGGQESSWNSDQTNSEAMTGSYAPLNAVQAAGSAAQDEVPVLRRAAMDWLARREHSRYELQQKLRQKFPDAQPEVIQRVLDQLQDDRLQSDERFVESYIRYRKSRGFGYLHINGDLGERGVAGALIEKHLIPDDEDWLVIAEDLVERKLRPGSRLSFASREHRRILRFLESRGFTSRQIRQVVDPRLGRQLGEDLVILD